MQQITGDYLNKLYPVYSNNDECFKQFIDHVYHGNVHAKLIEPNYSTNGKPIVVYAPYYIPDSILTQKTCIYLSGITCLGNSWRRWLITYLSTKLDDHYVIIVPEPENPMVINWDIVLSTIGNNFNMDEWNLWYMNPNRTHLYTVYMPAYYNKASAGKRFYDHSTKPHPTIMKELTSSEAIDCATPSNSGATSRMEIGELMILHVFGIVKSLVVGTTSNACSMFSVMAHLNRYNIHDLFELDPNKNTTDVFPIQMAQRVVQEARLLHGDNLADIGQIIHVGNRYLELAKSFN